MSIQDVIKKSVLESDMFNQAISISTIITITVNMLAALLMGVAIYWVYKKLYRGVVYSKNYAITLIGMTILTCMVTLAISTNIVISLGMVGALSIVRYRTAIKEPLDLLYMFWAITTGITVGASMYILALIGAVTVIVILAVMTGRVETEDIYIVVVHMTEDKTADEITRVLNKTKYILRSKILRSADIEMTMEVRPGRKGLLFAEQIREMEDVNDVSVIQYDGEYHG